jgi:hypothetical protein
MEEYEVPPYYDELVTREILPGGVMRIVLRAIIPAVALLLLTACPYRGTVPLGEPDPGLFEHGLLGGWSSVNGGVPGPVFMQLEGHRYLVMLPDECPHGGGWAYLAEAGGAMFLNIHTGTDGELHGIARIALDGDLLELRNLSERVDSLATDRESFRRAVAARVDDPMLYEPAVLYRRDPGDFAVQGDAAVALLQIACPYSGAAAAGEPEPGLFEPRLLGSWIDREAGIKWQEIVIVDAEDYVVEVLAAGESEYSIRMPRVHGESAVARAYLSRVAGALFLNIQVLDDERNFMVARMDFTGDEVRLRLLNAGMALLADDPPRFRAELARRIDDPTLYYRAPWALSWARSDSR